MLAYFRFCQASKKGMKIYKDFIPSYLLKNIICNWQIVLILSSKINSVNA